MDATRVGTTGSTCGAGAAVALALRLALGSPRPADASSDWTLVFDAASRELLTPLAWLRSGGFIRRWADAEVAAAWRRAAIAAELRGEHQLAILCDVVAALDAANVDVVVLKGLPLGSRLYGSPFVRCSADIDLFVPAPQRECAGHALRALGWRSSDGAPPWHESWSATWGGAEFHLELHSSLVSDHLAHITAPPPRSTHSIVGGVRVRAHDGEFLAPYLAVHLATHQMPPLLWLVDFTTLWRSLSLEQRGRAELAARDARVARYLTWARERAALVQRAAADDVGALQELGIGENRRRDVHSIWRHLSLAERVGDRARVAAAFLVPRRVRGRWRALARYTLARLRTRLRALAGVTRRYKGSPTVAARDLVAAPEVGRPLRLEREEMVTFTRDVVRLGAALWVRAPGGSMLPTIPRGALVRIGPVPTAGIENGDILLALTDDGEPVLHRAVGVSETGVVTRGDAALSADPFVPSRRIIGLATHVRHDGVEWMLSRQPVRSLAVSALKMRRRLARVLRRGG